MKLIWSHQAAQDLVDLREWIARDNSVAAGEVAKRLLDSAQMLIEFPKLGKPGRRSETREFVVAGTPYFLCYRISPRTVEIIAVVHGARDWPST
jgi:toxin ParE1/3/4